MPKLVTPSWMVTSLSEVQVEKHSSPSSLTPSGSAIVSSEVQPEKQRLGKALILPPNFTDLSAELPSKQLTPIVRRLAGSATDSSELQP